LSITADPRVYTVPFGRSTIAFSLPPGIDAIVIEPAKSTPLADPLADAVSAVGNPIGSQSLRYLAAGKRNVCIAVTDATRTCPDHLLVPPMVRELNAAGVVDEAITILVAVGAHRASTEEEKIEKLGADLAARFNVVDHDASDLDQLIAIGDGPSGIPFRVNRLAVEADLLLATGVVEPHQYAGYSGGGKTVAIGCAGEAIIAATHGPAMLDLPGTRLAEITRNPFQQAVRRVAKEAGLSFVGNAVLDGDGHIVQIAYGAPEAVHDHLVEIAGPLFTAPLSYQVDIAITGVGYPKDANLYQASRAASYVQFAPTPVVRPGGVIIIPAACPEGAGDGAGERRFFEAMSGLGGPPAVIKRIQRDGVLPGEQRAYIMARVLEQVTVIVAGAHDPDLIRAAGFLATVDMASALELAVTKVGTPATAAIIPHALLTLPIVA